MNDATWSSARTKRQKDGGVVRVVDGARRSRGVFDCGNRRLAVVGTCGTAERTLRYLERAPGPGVMRYGVKETDSIG